MVLLLNGCWTYNYDQLYWKADGTNYGHDSNNWTQPGPDAVCVGTYEACKPYFTEIPPDATLDPVAPIDPNSNSTPALDISPNN
jgi:hypothetical protein